MNFQANCRTLSEVSGRNLLASVWTSISFSLSCTCAACAAWFVNGFCRPKRKHCPALFTQNRRLVNCPPCWFEAAASDSLDCTWRYYFHRCTTYVYIIYRYRYRYMDGYMEIWICVYIHIYIYLCIYIYIYMYDIYIYMVIVMVVAMVMVCSGHRFSVFCVSCCFNRLTWQFRCLTIPWVSTMGIPYPEVTG